MNTDIQTRQANLDTSQMVAMANDMIRGISKLSLNEHKFLRTIVMQVTPQDKQLHTFTIKAEELAELIGVDKHDIYKIGRNMARTLMGEVIEIGDGNPKHKWEMFHWVDVCKYDKGVFRIKISEELQPYLVGLKKWYTMYALEDIIHFKSVYSIHIYELIALGMQDTKPYADETTEVYIPMNVIRKKTNTEKMYLPIGNFKSRVLDIAIRDINECTGYHVSYRDYKENRKVVGFYFLVQSGTRYRLYGEEPQEEPRQMTISDYI